MKKGDLLKLLEPFSDEQDVFVDLHTEYFPDGFHVFIQGVRAVPPWRQGPPDLIGLVADARNKEVVFMDFTKINMEELKAALKEQCDEARAKIMHIPPPEKKINFREFT